jgi:hypothetical protein
MATGKFYSVLTNAQLPQAGTAEPGSVYWVNSTGLLWFGVGDGTVVQLLASVPIPTIGAQGPKGDTGAIGPQGPALFFQGNWQGNVEYAIGSITTYNGNLYLANAHNIGNIPASNPYWTLLGAMATQNSEIVVTCDGAGATPTTGFKGFTEIPMDCQIVSWSIFANQIGSASFGVKVSTFANLPNTISITGGSSPLLSSAQKAEGDASTWNPNSFNQGDVIEVDLISVSTATFLTLCLQIKATN